MCGYKTTEEEAFGTAGKTFYIVFAAPQPSVSEMSSSRRVFPLSELRHQHTCRAGKLLRLI